MAQVIWNSDIDVYNSQVIPISVARSIAKYLPISDLLNFRLISSNANKSVDDSRLWVSLLKEIGIWKTNKRSKKADDDKPRTALNCMDSFTGDPLKAKIRMLTIYKCLNQYYVDLHSSKPYDKLKIFSHFQNPEQQCKILNSLMAYSKIDRDDNSRFQTQEKLQSIFEIFENALLRELEIHYDLQDYVAMRRFVSILIELKNDQTVIDFFLQKTVFDNKNDSLNIFELFKVDEFFIEEEIKQDSNDETMATQIISKINDSQLDSFFMGLAKMFNHESDIVDVIFPHEIPMMYRVGEELILNQLSDVFSQLINESKAKDNQIYLSMVPTIYYKLHEIFIPNLLKSDNIGPNYHNIIKELLDMQFESFLLEYIKEELMQIKSNSNEKISFWQESITKREQETSQNILRNVRADTKNDFLTSFKKAFTLGSSGNNNNNNSNNKSNNNNNNNNQESEKNTYSEVEAKEKILTENLKSLSEIFSLKLTMDILNDGKQALIRLLTFENFSIPSLQKSVYNSIQELFMAVIDVIGNDHLRPGFEKALGYLRTYNPLEEKSTSQGTIQPLVLFSDLVNVADIIIQMVQIFYKEELVHKKVIKNENSILNPSLQKKKKFEEGIDNFVADGLNIGIDVLVNEIEKAYGDILLQRNYCPLEHQKKRLDGPTMAALKVVAILDSNFDLLVGYADKALIDVFQQELAERVFQVIVRTIKKSTVSNDGAIILISDLNLYYECILRHIKSNKRLILPLYESLKKVGSIYLIDGNDSKSIGKLVSNLSKFNGIFGQEEIYEFVQRREDWVLVKKDVEKVMYGLSLGDCKLM